MAWTTPATFSATLMTVAIMNTQVRDNLNALKTPPSGLSYVSGRDYQVAGLGAFTAVDTALVAGDFQHAVVLAGSVARVEFLGSIQPKVNVGQMAFNIAVNGAGYFPAPGIAMWDATALSGNVMPIAFSLMLTGLTPGANTIRLEWSATHTAFLMQCTGTSAAPAMFYVVEAP